MAIDAAILERLTRIRDRAAPPDIARPLPASLELEAL